MKGLTVVYLLYDAIRFDQKKYADSIESESDGTERKKKKIKKKVGAPMSKNKMGSLFLLALTGFVLIGCGNNVDTDSSVESSADVEFKKDANADVKEKNDLKKEQDAQVEESYSESDYQEEQYPAISEETNQQDTDALLKELVEQEAKDPSLNQKDPTYHPEEDAATKEKNQQDTDALLKELVEQEAKDPNLN